MSTKESDIIRYSPTKLDVFNMEANRIETVELKNFLKAHGHNVPGMENVVSIVQNGKLLKSPNRGIDFQKDDLAATFEGMIAHTPLVVQLKHVVRTLQEKMHRPVELEFASDGEHIYLVQCREQHVGHQTTTV